jgi:large subunit ribosomal protein L15
MPLYRRLPHRGFRNINRVEYAVINVADLEAADGTKLGPVELAAQSLIRKADGLLKVLGNGEITRAVTVTAHAVSASAKAKIEKAGGKVVLLGGEAKPE